MKHLKMTYKLNILLPALFCMAISSFNAYSKPIGNEWINYGQRYYKIPVHEEGIYRVDFYTLQSAGIPIGTFDPRSFQIFAKGKEQPIYVKNENTGLFQPGDYIEFYGKGNDGWFDQYLYSDIEDHPNDNYSLFTDTAVYYLTWNNLLNNKRFNIETDTNFSGYTPSEYFWHTSREDYTSRYFAGKTNNYGVTDPEYTSTQGWFDVAFNAGSSRVKNISTSNIYTNGPNAEIEFAVIGASDYRFANPNHHIRIEFADTEIDTLYKGYQLIRINESLPASSLGLSSTSFIFRSINDLGVTSRNTISYISVKYPHEYKLGEYDKKLMLIPPSQNDKTFLNISDFNVSNDDPLWIWDITSNNKVKVKSENGSFKALLPNPNNKRECFITSESLIKNIDRITPVNHTSATPGRFNNFLAPGNFNSDYLIITHQSLMNEASNYKDYRNSTGYKVLLVDEEELYHQFSYGIRKHPLALRNFSRHLIEEYDESPRKLFLIGKAYKAGDYRRNATRFNNTRVPSFGDPPSDVLITAGITDELFVPAIPTGRLNAREPAEVSLYLDKMIQYETAQQNPEKWMKNVLHFGGGSNKREQQTLAGYLNHYKNILEDTLMGAYVRTFLKSTTDPIEINRSDSLRDIINNGVSIMTFFGHAGGIGFDISIDNPASYNNYGKYPFLFANSCFAGDLFDRHGRSSSEEFVLIENKGTIGYLASTTAAGAKEQHRYSNELFRNIASRHYAEPIGVSIREAIRAIQSTNPYIKNACLLKALHGDPALKINYQKKPDYKITAEDIYFTPEEVSTEMESFKVNIVATNIGKAVNDSMFVELTRIFPEGDTDIKMKRVRAPFYKDTISFSFEVDRERGAGLNRFNVMLDVYNDIEELTVLNNSASASLMIRSTDIYPFYPYKYAVVPESRITLKASTGNPFAAEMLYVFEMDTTGSFANPIESDSLYHSGGVVQWTPQTILQDSTVYFWRVSPAYEYNNSHSWRESSFQYIENRRGWSQAHFDQFGENTYQYVKYNAEGRNWQFVNTVVSIYGQTGYHPYIDWGEQKILRDGSIIEHFSCLANGHGMYFAVFDTISGMNWESLNQGDNIGEYENVNCRQNRPHGTFDFFTSSEDWRNKVENFLVNVVPEGYHVLGVSHRNHNAESYSEGLYEAFESLGSTNIRSLQNNRPYMIFGTKGSPPGTANEVIGGSISSIIQLNDSISTKWNEGYIKSEIIGPAKEWNSLHWRQESYDGFDTDSVRLSVLGVDRNGQTDTLLNNIPPDSTSIYNLDQHIDAEQYPYMHLIVFMRDDSLHTAAQMRKWQVLYEEIPETAIDPSKHFVFESDTLMEGEKLLFSTAIHNISDFDMDSLLVHYWVVDKNRKKHYIDYPRQAPHPAGDIIIDTVKVDTRGLAGINTFWMEVNPDNDQPEQYHFNNVANLSFYVGKDKTNPMLEVTFDGKHILDGDLVSPNPYIQISVRDENPFLLLDDTTYVNVFLKKPGQTEPQQIYFIENGQENMRFTPATDSNNQCMVQFNPELLEDGTYRLIVQAMDVSRNESGKEDYSIDFEVVNESTITNIFNYPNPFSTSTQFVYTLTGSEIPTYFKIQIMTITGRVVKEIDLLQKGEVRPGYNNITDYAWDGTDRYGQRLANGVYLYRVVSKIEGEDIKHRSTSADNYFHQGLGKMYLIR